MARLIIASDTHVMTELAGSFRGRIQSDWEVDHKRRCLSFHVILIELLAEKVLTGPDLMEAEKLVGCVREDHEGAGH